MSELVDKRPDVIDACAILFVLLQYTGKCNPKTSSCANKLLNVGLTALMSSFNDKIVPDLSKDNFKFSATIVKLYY